MNKLLVLKYIFSSFDSFATVDKMNGINHPLLYKRFSVVTLLQGIFTILLREVFKFIPATRVGLSERVAFPCAYRTVSIFTIEIFNSCFSDVRSS